MIVLGIDPGLATTGWGIIKKEDNQNNLINFGCILTSKNTNNNDRLLQIYHELSSIIKKYKPTVISIEKIFFNTNAKTAFSIGEVRGIIKICALLHKLNLQEFTPLQIKSSLVGYGRADKNQVQNMVKFCLQLKQIPKPDDAADALAAALTYSSFNIKLTDLKR